MTKYFVATGRVGAFPYDMLRYDRCWPTGAGDVNAGFHNPLDVKDIVEI